MSDSAPRCQFGMIVVGIIPTTSGDDSVIGTLYPGLSVDCGVMCMGVVVQLLSKHPIAVLIVDKHHILLESCLLGIEGIFAISGGESIHTIVKTSAGSVLSPFRYKIIVKTICVKLHIAVAQLHLAP